MTRISTKTFLVTVLFFAFGSVRSQGPNTGFNWKFEEGNKLIEEKFYDQAAEVWKELVDANPENSNLNYKLGYSYFNSYTQKDKALKYLEKASERRNREYSAANISDYDPFDPLENNAPPEVDYYLAKAYQLEYELDKGALYFAKFADQSDPKHILHRPALRGIEEVENAKKLMKDPKNYDIHNIGEVINGPYPDFSPVVSVDGNALFFTSRRVRPDSSNIGIIDDLANLPYEDIYVSYKDRDGKWQTPELLNINTPGHLATINVSADGQTLFMYRDDGGDGNIYESRLVGELWSDPVLLGSDINTKAWETHAAMTADGNTIYFVSDRKNGIGGRDIYRSVKLPDGTWSKSQSLGNVVNTPYDEEAPFIHPNGRTLFFASKGHNSMGGFDIFYSELQDDGTWSIPKNIGYPINTVDDDVFFVTTADGRRGFFSSDKDGGLGEKDIYYVDLPAEMEAENLTVLKGFIIPPPGEKIPASTTLFVTDRATGEVRSYLPRQRDGVYVVILPPCKEYNLDYRVDGQTIHTEDIYVECETAYQEINKEIYLNPVTISGPASIVDIPRGQGPGGDGRTTQQQGTTTTAPDGTRTTTTPDGKTVVTTPEGKSITTKPDGTVTVTEAGKTTTTKPDGTVVVSQGGKTTTTTPDGKTTTTEKKPSATEVISGKPDKVTTTGKPIPDNVVYAAEYEKFYAYNQKDIELNEAKWQAFIKDLMAVVQEKGKANVVVEASASKVPTATFGTNENLSKSRMDDARKRLVEAIKTQGGDPDKVFIEAINHLVRGPAYIGDPQDSAKYEPYQYVKLKVH